MNRRFNVDEVLDAAHDYYLASKRRVSIEYALMRGINDQEIHARQLANRLNHYGDNWAHVNPIPLNPIEGSKWTASKPEDERRFLEILHNAGITATSMVRAASLRPKPTTHNGHILGSGGTNSVSLFHAQLDISSLLL